jgi:vacuolar iron transporter family protein
MMPSWYELISRPIAVNSVRNSCEYLFPIDIQSALLWSVAVTLVALIVFGGVKAKVTGSSVFRGAFQTALVGSLAAGAAFLIARFVSGFGA